MGLRLDHRLPRKAVPSLYPAWSGPAFALLLATIGCAPAGRAGEGTGGIGGTGGNTLTGGTAGQLGGISGTGAPTGSGGSNPAGSGGTAPSADAGGADHGVMGTDAATDPGAASPDAAADRPAGTADGGSDRASDAVTAMDSGSADLAGWNLVWSDEFEQDGTPSTANWRYETGFVRNQELQWYQAANATVAAGILTIEGRREQVANPNYTPGSGDWKLNRQNAAYTSTSMTTSGKRTFTYGRFEARARIDVRQGSWPAFWTVGSTGGWPAGGEVDIMEFYAGKVLANVCKPMGSTCGWSSLTKQVSTLGANWASQFHVWVMEWDATKIDLYLDDVLMNHFNVADAVAPGTTNPYVARPVTIIVNLALGANGGDPAGTAFPLKYEVDYVRVYQRAP